MVEVEGKPMEWQEGLTVEEVLKRLGVRGHGSLGVGRWQARSAVGLARNASADGAVAQVKEMMSGG